MVDAARVGGSTPSYQHSLALLGQYLNSKRANRITIAEVDTGFLLYFFPSGRWTKPTSVPVLYTELLELTDTVAGSTTGKDGILIKGGEQRDKRNPVCPMGYDVFLRALGNRLDRRSAVSVTVAETRDRLYINYWVDKATFVIRDGRRQAVSTVQMETYDAAGVLNLLRLTSEAQAQEMTRYERGLRINPHDHISMMDAAFMFENDGNYREAEALFNRVAAAVPNHPEVYYQLARLAIARGDKRTALAAVKRALKFGANDPAVHDLSGRILRQSGKLKDATAAFERAVELDPENGILHYHLSKAYEASGRNEDAAAQMAMSATLNAAPAWDMVQEDLTIEVRPAEQEQVTEKLPSEAALLPPVIEPAGDFSPALPSMTTTFEPAAASFPSTDTATAWPTTGVPGLPTLTTFDNQPLAASAAVEQAASQPMTLEQRMLAARNASLEVRPRPLAAPPEPDPTPPRYEATEFPALEQIEPAPSSQSRSTEPAEAPRVPREEARPRETPPPVPREQAVPRETPLPARDPAPLPREQAAPRVSREQALRREALPRAVPQARAAEQPPAQSAETSANAVELAAEIMVIQRALETEPNRADLHRKLGFLLARQGKTAEAATEFRKALQASRTSL